MIHASPIARSNVAPTLLRRAFSHSLGQNWTFMEPEGMSALPPKADIVAGSKNVRF